ncbi:MAG: FHA domain-containing protein [Deltaproteobacteria bacterium]|nr:FHA domain-containing protein [Deltaproteobacteria bacterium]
MTELNTLTLSGLSLSAATYAERYTLPTFRLRVVSGPDAGLEATFARRAIVVGSGPDCDLVLVDASVSRHHLRIVGDRSGYRVADLGSKNGTWFAGSRLGEITAGASATLRLGQTELQYEQQAALHEIALSRESEFGVLQGQSVEMREAFARLADLCAGTEPAVIEGEPGTGKRAAARAVHARSEVASGPLIQLDCSTVDPGELASVAGAAIAAAAGGSLLLLEFDELPAPHQPQLLDLVQNSGLTPPRLLITLAVPLEQSAREGRLHKQAQNLMKSRRVTLPPLRHRPDDIALLVDVLLREIQAGLGDPRPLIISHRTMAALMAHPWPGNVRELRRHLERAAQMANSRPAELAVRPPTGEPAAERPLDVPDIAYSQARTQVLAQFDRTYCQHLLQRAGGNHAAAAKLAGLPLASLEQLLLRALGEPGDDR